VTAPPNALTRILHGNDLLKLVRELQAKVAELETEVVQGRRFVAALVKRAGGSVVLTNRDWVDLDGSTLRVSREDPLFGSLRLSLLDKDAPKGDE
jgi:hypothetical protein